MITVCSMWTPELAIFGQQTERNKRAYCEGHGYRFDVCHERLSDRHPSWDKLIILRRHLDTEEDWVFWLDADAIYTDLSAELESLIVAAGDRDMIIATDENGINCGSFGLRSCDWSRRLVESAWAKTEHVNHPWWEQRAIADLIGQRGEDPRVCVVEKRKLNAYPADWQPGDFILHCPGMSRRHPSQRASVLRKHDPVVLADNARTPRCEIGRPFDSTAGLQRMLDTIPKIGRMVEIGSFAGVSTEVFAIHAEHVTAVDPFLDPSVLPRFVRRMAPYANVTVLRELSLVAAPRFASASLDLVYIDADHSYSGVKSDIAAWAPKVKPGGWIAGHDYNHERFPGVVQAVREVFGDATIFADTSWLVRA